MTLLAKCPDPPSSATTNEIYRHGTAPEAEFSTQDSQSPQAETFKDTCSGEIVLIILLIFLSNKY